MADRTPTPKKNPREAEAYADYVDMLADRSLEALEKRYRASTGPVPTRQLSRLKIWSTTYRWQERLTDSINAKTQAKQDMAAELDADTFLLTSRELNERAQYTNHNNLDAVIKVRESVRAKRGAETSVSVTVSVEIRHLAEQIAKKHGVTPEYVLEQADAVASGAWSR